MANFKVGDRVVVISNCQTMNQIGTVKDIGRYSWDMIKVELDSGDTISYKKESLRLCKEGEKMTNNLSGNYSVALVKFLKGSNTTKKYAFALYGSEIKVGDLVVCDCSNHFCVAEVVDIVNKSDYTGIVTSEIVCSVDFSNYEQRKENRKQMEILKKQMDEMVAKNQELILYQAIAEKSPEMAEMLAQYKALVDA